MQEDGITNAFRHISEAQLEQYRLEMPVNDDSAMDIIGNVLGLDSPRKDIRQHMRLSMSVRALNFAVGRKFSNVKTGIIFNIIQTLLQSISQGDSKEACELCMLQYQ